MNRIRKHKNPRAVMFLMWLISQKKKEIETDGDEEAQKAKKICRVDVRH